MTAGARVLGTLGTAGRAPKTPCPWVHRVLSSLSMDSAADSEFHIALACHIIRADQDPKGSGCGNWCILGKVQSRYHQQVRW